MTYDSYDFDGYIELNHQEISRLRNGDQFLTVIRQANRSNICNYGYPGDTLGATETGGIQPQYNVKMLSIFLANGQLIMVLARMKNHV